MDTAAPDGVGGAMDTVAPDGVGGAIGHSPFG